MAEVSDRLEEDKERPLEDSLAELREEVEQEHGLDVLGDRASERKEAAETEQETAEQPSESKRDQAEVVDAPADASKQEGESGEPEPASTDAKVSDQETESVHVSKSIETIESKDQPLTDDEIEQARRDIQKEYGPDGLGEDPDGGADSEAEFNEIGSFSRSGSQVLLAELEQGPDEPAKELHDLEVQTSDLRRFPADPERAERETETRTLEAVDYGKGAVVRVPKTDLEREGYESDGENAIVRLELRNVDTEDVDTVFARYHASDRRAEAHVGDIGGEKGSKFEPVGARGYNEDGLVRDFERGRCEHMKNVRLEHENGKMFLNVDERRVELEGWRLSTSGSHVVLRGKLEGEDSCKVEFDGRRASVRFGRDYPVEGMRVKDDVLSVKYEQSRSEKHEARLHLEHVDAPERPSLNQFDKPKMLEHVRFSNHPERIVGAYQFSLDRYVGDEVRTLNEQAWNRGGKSARDSVKGEIGERLTPNLLESTGWERIQRHPFNETKKEDARANGTDWLVKTPDGKIAIMEVKWFDDVDDAIRKGSVQVAQHFDENPYYHGQKIECAYAAVMDWDVSDKPLKILVKQIRPKELS